MNEFIGLILMGLILAIYFLPTIVGRNKRNATAILMLNLFLGWTVIGWVIALVWAFTNDTQVQKVVYVETEKEKKNNDEKTYTKEELQKMLDNMKD